MTYLEHENRFTQTVDLACLQGSKAVFNRKQAQFELKHAPVIAGTSTGRQRVPCQQTAMTIQRIVN